MNNIQRSEGNAVEGTGRQLSLEFHKRRKRRRPLVVPETESDLSFLHDAYREESTFDTSASSSQRRNYRPLPSTQILTSIRNETNSTRGNTVTSTRSSTTKPSLLLRNFYKSIGIEDPPIDESDGLRASEVTDSDKNKRGAMDEIDDPSCSTLKIGHHRRYLKLKQQQTSKLTFAQQKEARKLRQLISKEQTLYGLALDNFHENHKSRYLIGFESNTLNEASGDPKASATSAFCRWASFYGQSLNREWGKRIMSGQSEDIV